MSLTYLFTVLGLCTCAHTVQYYVYAVYDFSGVDHITENLPWYSFTIE